MNSHSKKILGFFKATSQKLVTASGRFLKLKKNYDRQKRSEQMDRQLVYSLSPKKIPNSNQIKHLKKILGPQEKLWLRISVLVLVSSLLFLGIKFYRDHLELSPIEGGSYSEGLVGAPKYINPLYNYNRDVDSDLSALIFSSLFKHDDAGKLASDLAEKWEVGEDTKTYTITLRDNVKFHNGDKLIADDVVFTFEAIKNPEYNSPWRQMFLGAEIEKIDDRTIKFTLGESYAPFLELLTFGILPQNLWTSINPETADLADLNLKPIGSGPYKFKTLTKNKAGEIKEYNLEANSDYFQKEPYISKIVFKFFPNIQEAVSALNNNSVDGLSYLPHENQSDVLAKNSMNFYKLKMPRLTALFFNKKANAYLNDKSIKTALALSLDKSKIVNEALSGDAQVIDGPILPDSFAYNQALKKYGYDFGAAEKLLDESGWQKVTINTEEAARAVNITEEEAGKDANMSMQRDIAAYASSSGLEIAGNWRVKTPKAKGVARQYLTVSLTVVDSVDNLKVADEIKKLWSDLGVKTDIKSISASSAEGDVVKPRNFEILLFSQVLGSDPDVYPFWHSSQAGEGGPNLADYRNKDVDALLESARLATDQGQRIEKYNKFQEIITDELPAIFLYSSYYNYPQNKQIKGFNKQVITDPADRFSGIANWYEKTKKKLKW
ncbi:MAG: peptide ABC transporter substrate-binding protein [Candidatus Falkowbacteria bacterium]